jgi:hypothetical protein
MMRVNQKSQPLTLGLTLLLAFLSLGCGLSGVVGDLTGSAEPLPTRTPRPTFTPTPAGAAFVNVDINTDPTAIPVQEQPTASAPAPESPLPTPVGEAIEQDPTPEPAPTEPPVEENSGPPVVTIVQNMNVRTGPGTNYPIAGPGPAGEKSTVVGRNADNSWVQVEYPVTADGAGWVYADLVQIDGDLSQVDVVQVAAPPPPPPAPEVPQEEAAPPPPPEPQYQFTPTGWYASENAAIVHMKGRIKDPGGGLVNGFSVLADNGSFSVLSHPTGASVWYPDKGDGEWDIVLPNLFDAQGWWELTVVRYECDFFASFDAQCKSFTKLSEDVRVEVRTPEESIINADWTCHFDCNTGLYVDAYRR